VIAALAIAPLVRAYTVREVDITTLQAISGAGPVGLPALTINDNVIPYIADEENKLRSELLKIFGQPNGGNIEMASFSIQPLCTRVPVSDGHMVVVKLRTEERISPDDAQHILAAFESDAWRRGLPTAVRHPIRVTAAHDRPQTRRDRDWLGGMGVTVGRCGPWRDDRGLVLVAVGHNKARGTVGNTLLCAEAMCEGGYLGLAEAEQPADR
jgi:aspartate-semialdehyde dehydrogenase